MILGVGMDLLEISRMEKALERESFSLRVFTEEERRQARGRVSFLAGCFAVKECIRKHRTSSHSQEAIGDGKSKWPCASVFAPERQTCLSLKAITAIG